MCSAFYLFVFTHTYVSTGGRLKSDVITIRLRSIEFDCNDSLEGFVLKSVTQHTMEASYTQSLD